AMNIIVFFIIYASSFITTYCNIIPTITDSIQAPLWHSSGRPSHGSQVDDGLFATIKPYDVICLIIEKRPDGADTQAEGAGSQVEILPYVASVEVDVPVGPLAVFPPGPFHDGSPDKGHLRRHHHPLAEGSLGYISSQIASFQELEVKGMRPEVIDTRLNPLHRP